MVVNLIDVGMVIRLEESDRLNFINFIKCVLHGDGEKCAEMIYSLSIFDGKKIGGSSRSVTFNRYVEHHQRQQYEIRGLICYPSHKHVGPRSTRQRSTSGNKYTKVCCTIFQVC